MDRCGRRRDSPRCDICRGAGGRPIRRDCLHPHAAAVGTDDPDASYPAQEALGLALEGYPGYAGSWVSTDLTDAELEEETAYVPTYHVLVTGDGEQAHAKFREVWPGGLCVQQRDVVPEQDARAAQDAVMGADIPGMEGSGGSINRRSDS